MLAGRAPTHGISPIGARVYAICHVPAPPLAEAAKAVSPELAAIVHRTLALDPNERFASATEMLAALARVAPIGADIEERALSGRVAPKGGDDCAVAEMLSALGGGELTSASVAGTSRTPEDGRGPPGRRKWVYRGLTLTAAATATVLAGSVVERRSISKATESFATTSSSEAPLLPASPIPTESVTPTGVATAPPPHPESAPPPVATPERTRSSPPRPTPRRRNAPPPKRADAGSVAPAPAPTPNSREDL
jgi:serine/threonine-protein kinase